MKKRGVNREEGQQMGAPLFLSADPSFSSKWDFGAQKDADEQRKEARGESQPQPPHSFLFMNALGSLNCHPPFKPKSLF